MYVNRRIIACILYKKTTTWYNVNYYLNYILDKQTKILSKMSKFISLNKSWGELRNYYSLKGSVSFYWESQFRDGGEIWSVQRKPLTFSMWTDKLAEGFVPR